LFPKNETKSFEAISRLKPSKKQWEDEADSEGSNAAKKEILFRDTSGASYFQYLCHRDMAIRPSFSSFLSLLLNFLRSLLALSTLLFLLLLLLFFMFLLLSLSNFFFGRFGEVFHL
jgi:hypothetical protein